MYLKELKIHNFRCFENLEVSLDSHLTVIVGNNGVGKTAILEGAVIAASTFFLGLDGVSARGILSSDAMVKSFALGDEFDDDYQSQFPVEIEATGYFGLGNNKVAEETAELITWKRGLNSSTGKTTVSDAKQLRALSTSVQDCLRAGDADLQLPLIAYYGTGRLWDLPNNKKHNAVIKNSRLRGYEDCIDGMADLKLMNDWFEKMTIRKYQQQERNESQGFSALDLVYRAMESCLQSATGYEDVRVQYDLNTHSLMVYYKENGQRHRISLEQMSAGYKGTVSLIADIAYRMTLLNPMLGDKVLEETTGIVLIDEVDLHLHPLWQQRILGDLQSIFPKIQFVVSTHAPAVINSVHSENLRVLENNKLFSVQHQVYGNDVNSILKHVMGAVERPTDVVERFDEFYRMLAEKQFDQAEVILNEISRIRGGSDREVAGCRVKLQLEKLKNR